ncbi:hypothetical protein J4E85_009504 [Alternaria conjuncta]|uniref:uncharacterized protein n=1 Tax=Alternaria conjuncta TaxID=181017 RepID=UPI00221E4E3F|nr:uncharacterized protein J4E85_009504 [Alternaria conjuncta]KAI4919246.1 hypothetical protein J4E85_009504 [Alternaria conjuncta]
MTNDVDMSSSDFEGSNADLYAMDLPLSLAGRLAAHQATAQSTNVSGSTESEHLELQATPEPPPSPPFFKPASWNAIDAATAERQANMQQEIDAQELRDLKRCLDLRDYTNRTAYEKIHDSEPLVVPKLWSMSEIPLKSWVKHPFLLEEYLEGEQFSREAIRVRREYLEIVDCGSPEIECLAALEKHAMEIRASRLLADILLEAILHATEKLILEIGDGDKTKKKPVSSLCRRLMAHSTHTENNSELIRAVEAISEMEPRHMPWRFNAALESRTETSPTSSAAAPLDSPPADDICLSQEQMSLPLPDEKSPPKDLRRLSVKFQENLQLLSPGK